MLHAINKELDMPGFCCDETSGTVFYRLAIPCINLQVDEKLFHTHLNAIKSVCEMFGTIVQAIAIKAMGYEEMLTKAEGLQAGEKP